MVYHDAYDASDEHQVVTDHSTTDTLDTNNRIHLSSRLKHSILKGNFTSIYHHPQHQYQNQTTTMASSTTTAPRTHTGFFYGTLMVPQIFFRVTCQNATPPSSWTSNYTFTPALLHDFSRRKVEGNDFPGITAQQGHVVIGFVVEGITDRDLKHLDAFEGEGDMYVRRPVRVQMLEDEVFDSQGKIRGEVLEREKAKWDSGKEGSEGLVMKDAQTYIWCDPEINLEAEEWDYEEFRREKMSAWVGGHDEEYQGSEDMYKGWQQVEELLLNEEGEDEKVRTERIVSVIAELQGKELGEAQREEVLHALQANREAAAKGEEAKEGKEELKQKVEKVDENEKMGSAV